jgi:alkylation response protein AidB-like acyl-CoA dehydrogenase
VADFDTKVHILRLLCRKVVADLIAKGGAGPEASIIKLYYSELLQSLMRFGVDIAGPATHRFATKSQVVGWESGAWMLDYLDSWGWTIGGGTNEIQRTVVGERVLGLPREPSST